MKKFKNTLKIAYSIFEGRLYFYSGPEINKRAWGKITLEKGWWVTQHSRRIALDWRYFTQTEMLEKWGNKVGFF